MLTSIFSVGSNLHITVFVSGESETKSSVEFLHFDVKCVNVFIVHMCCIV